MRTAEEEFDENCAIPMFKQSAIQVMVWGCVMKGKKGPLVVLEYPGGRGGGMNSERYQTQVLNAHLFDFYQQMSEERGLVFFQQDDTPSHHSKSTLTWLAQNSVDIFLHPASSPDLSPIKPLWKTLKTYIRARPHLPTNLDGLKAAVREAWDQITETDIDKHVKHMQARVQAVLKANGGHTKFQYLHVIVI
jgi:hypothetical protein